MVAMAEADVPAVRRAETMWPGRVRPATRAFLVRVSLGTILVVAAYRGVMPQLHRLGWLLFVVCAVLYTAAGVRDGDPLIVSGSVIFGVACVMFLMARPADDVDVDADADVDGSGSSRR
jgi:hypothetical protein